MDAWNQFYPTCLAIKGKGSCGVDTSLPFTAVIKLSISILICSTSIQDQVQFCAIASFSLPSPWTDPNISAADDTLAGDNAAHC